MKLAHHFHIKGNVNDFKNGEIIQRNEREMCFAGEEIVELRFMSQCPAVLKTERRFKVFYEALLTEIS